MRRLVLVSLAFAVALLAGACGEPGTDTGGGDPYGGGAPPATPEETDAPVSSTPRPGGDAGGKALEVRPQEGLVDIRSHPFEEAKPAPDGRSVRLFFWDGIEQCGGVDHVHIRTAPEEVELTLFLGRNPRAEVCTEQAVYKVITVELDEPLDGRAIVDGAEG